MKLHAISAAVWVTLLSTAQAQAQTAPAPATNLDTVQVTTGTRTSGLKAVDSPSPVQVLDAGGLGRGAQADLIQSLARIVPSYASDAKGGDMAALTTAARLRGLSPNHTLILIDGKRVHGTANVNVTTSPYAGAAAPDLGLIPLAAIERIEVLQDGAAAQYGSDAIAGVINVILKKQSQGGSATLDVGNYFSGGGFAPHAAFNIGLKPVEGAYLNLTADVRYRGHSDQSDPDARFSASKLAAASRAADRVLINAPDYPSLNHTFGDAQVRQQLFTAKGGLDLGRGLEAYTLLTAARKHGEAIQNYRGLTSATSSNPATNVSAATISRVYPLGYSPVEAQDQDDQGLTLGLRGRLTDDWRFDLSSTYGRNNAQVFNWHSLNPLLERATQSGQTDFDIGHLRTTQWTNNLELNRDIEVGWAAPLNLTLGTELRRDTYAIGAGEPASYKDGGSTAFPGYSPADAGGHGRNNKALYIDVAGSPVSWAQFDAAARTERYSDFGSASVGKLSGRFEVAPTVALRSTVSTGFRAPSLAEAYYSATQVSPTTATVFLPNYASATRLLQIDQLKPEKSRNLSIGAVFTPSSRITASVDAYQIWIKDRILRTGSLVGTSGTSTLSALVNQAIALNGNALPASVTTTQVSTFLNGGDSRTRGVDVVFTLAGEQTDFGKVDWSVSGNYNETRLSKLKQAATGVSTGALVNRESASALEQGAPAYRLSLGGVLRKGAWTVDLRENLHGPIAFYTSVTSSGTTTFYKNRQSAKFTTDIDVNYAFDKAWSVSVGASNLFGNRPDELNAAYRQKLNDTNSVNVAPYSGISPIGINGGYYYARANYKF